MNLYCNKKLIIKDVYEARTFIKRLRGYMFYKNPHVDGILFKPCNSIHTYFMRFDIDVLFLNEFGVVIEKKNNLPPRKVVMPISKANCTVETIGGGFEMVKIGDKIKLG